MVTPWAWSGRKVPQAEGNDQESTPGSSNWGQGAWVGDRGASVSCSGPTHLCYRRGSAGGSLAPPGGCYEPTLLHSQGTEKGPEKGLCAHSLGPGGNSNHPCCRGSAALPCSSPGGIEEAYFRSTNPLFSPGFALRWLAVP